MPEAPYSSNSPCANTEQTTFGREQVSTSNKNNHHFRLIHCQGRYVLVCVCGGVYNPPEGVILRPEWINFIAHVSIFRYIYF